MPDTTAIGVFISYSHVDSAEVEPLVVVLKKHGLKVYWDKDVKHREQWKVSLRQELTLADCVICCWSAASSKSNWVTYEAGWAHGQGKLLNLILTEGASPHDAAADFHGVQWYAMSGAGSAKEQKALCDEIKAMGRPRRTSSTRRSEDLVTRLDRKPQIDQLDKELRAALSANRSSMIWLLPTHAKEFPEDFVRRVGIFRLPEILASTPTLKTFDEAYESMIITLDWPVGHASVAEGLDSLARQLAAETDVAVQEPEPPDFADSLAGCEGLFPLIDIKLPLHHWRPADATLLCELLGRLGKVQLSGSTARFFGVFVSARYTSERQRKLVVPGKGLFRRLVKRRVSVDDYFAALAAEFGVFCMPALPKIGYGDVQDWHGDCSKSAGIPQHNQFTFRTAVFQPFADRDGDDVQLHYSQLSGTLESALREAIAISAAPR